MSSILLGETSYWSTVLSFLGEFYLRKEILLEKIKCQ